MRFVNVSRLEIQGKMECIIRRRTGANDLLALSRLVIRIRTAVYGSCSSGREYIDGLLTVDAWLASAADRVPLRLQANPQILNRLRDILEYNGLAARFASAVDDGLSANSRTLTVSIRSPEAAREKPK
jgi:hypothetical protein